MTRQKLLKRQSTVLTSVSDIDRNFNVMEFTLNGDYVTSIHRNSNTEYCIQTRPFKTDGTLGCGVNKVYDINISNDVIGYNMTSREIENEFYGVEE